MNRNTWNNPEYPLMYPKHSIFLGMKRGVSNIISSLHNNNNNLVTPAGLKEGGGGGGWLLPCKREHDALRKIGILIFDVKTLK